VRAFLSCLVPTLLVIAAVGPACTPQGDPGIPTDGFTDDFDREDLGELWNNTGASWRIVDGRLNIRNCRNRPLWLRRTLPHDVRIEFDAESTTPEGDIKAEVFGDGSSRATEESYTATSYVIIFGGWSNSFNGIARMSEHADDRVQGARGFRVQPGHVYHMKVERIGSRITAWADDTELGMMDDARPLAGRGHDHFAFNDWTVELWFDNLHITPL
jgi:hypothetical protein